MHRLRHCRGTKFPGIAVARVYELLCSVDIVDGYLIPSYDVLHTLGSEYLVDDVVDLAWERGLAL